jgi:hypothetical protein
MLWALPTIEFNATLQIFCTSSFHLRLQIPLKFNTANSSNLQNSIQEEIKCRLKLGNACYYSVQNLLSSSLLSKTLKIKIYIYRTIILLVVLYGCETCSLTLREERRLPVLENRVLRRVFGPKRDEITGEWRKLHNEGLGIFNPYTILCGW